MANIKIVVLSLAVFGFYYANGDVAIDNESVLKAMAGVDPKKSEERVKVELVAGPKPCADKFTFEFSKNMAVTARLVNTKLTVAASQWADNLCDDFKNYRKIFEQAKSDAVFVYPKILMKSKSGEGLAASICLRFSTEKDMKAALAAPKGAPK